MSHEKILIVEDETRVAQALSRALSLPEGGEHDVETCDSGEAALEKIRLVGYDLVITDLRMSGMTGLELLEQIRFVSPSTRSILITAFGTSQVEERARQIANAYLPKPFSMKNFVQTVSQTLIAAPVPRRLIAFSEQGLRSIQERMELLRTDVNGLGVQLLDQSGQLLTATGQYGAFDATAFLALLGNTMTAANETSRILHDDEAFDIHYHEGKNYEIYAAQISEQVFLSLILERYGGVAGRIGMVWMYLRRAIAELRTLLKMAIVLGSAGLGTGLESAVDTALDEMFAPEQPPEPTIVADSPVPKRRKTYDFSKPLPAKKKPKESNNDPVPAPNAPPANSQKPSLNQVLTYDQARALGLIDLDNLEAD